MSYYTNKIKEANRLDEERNEKINDEKAQRRLDAMYARMNSPEYKCSEEEKANRKNETKIYILHLLLLKYFNEKYGDDIDGIKALLGDENQLKIAIKEYLENIGGHLDNTKTKIDASIEYDDKRAYSLEDNKNYDTFNSIFYIRSNHIDVLKREYPPEKYDPKVVRYDFRSIKEDDPKYPLNFYNIIYLNAMKNCSKEGIVFFLDFFKIFKKTVMQIDTHKITFNFNEEIDTIIDNTTIFKDLKKKGKPRSVKSCYERHEEEKANYKRIRKQLEDLGPITINENSDENIETPIVKYCNNSTDVNNEEMSKVEQPLENDSTIEPSANVSSQGEYINVYGEGDGEGEDEGDGEGEGEGGGNFKKKCKTKKRKTHRKKRKTKKQKHKTKTRKTKRKRRY